MGVFYFAKSEQAREMLNSPLGVAATRDLKDQLPMLDDVYGLEAPQASDSPADPQPVLREVRGRRGSIVMTFVEQTPDTDLVPFVAAFLSQANHLAKWSEPAAQLAVVQGRTKTTAELALGDQGMLTGTLRLKPKGSLTMEVRVSHRAGVATLAGIRTGEETPYADVAVSVGLVDQTLSGTTDASGAVQFELDSMTQRSALKVHLNDPAARLDARGLVKLRFGFPKEASLDDGSVPTVAAPRDGSTSQVARQVLEFLASSFSEDHLAFPRTVNEDKRGLLDYSPPPLMTEIVAWRLAKAAGKKELASMMKALLPLGKLESITKAGPDDPTADAFDAFDIPIALALETGDTSWAVAAQAHLRRMSAREVKPWCGDMARGVLAAWRLYELLQDDSLREDARRRTSALIDGIAQSEEPSQLTPAHTIIRESGAAEPHAWAALALFKAAEVDKDARARPLAIKEVDHLLEKHITRGTIGYSQLAPGETPGMAYSQTEGAHAEAAAAVQALLLAYLATNDKKYHQGAMEVRAHVLLTWRKDYGGFGRLDYWDAPVEGKDPAKHLQPIASRRQASIYQQSWALESFLPIFYPYWGDGIPEDKPHWKLLDLPPLRWLRKGKESEE